MMPLAPSGLFQRIVRFGYEAVTSKGLRKAPQPVTRSEDAELTPVERRKLIANARDINRNFVAAAWMIRRHLDYVTTFSFQARTTNTALNARAEKLLLNWSHKDRCDVAQRHPFRRMLRLMEARAVIDGDVFPHRLASGQLQVIEGDRVRTPNGGLPDGLTAADFTHGIQTSDFGGIKNLCVCKRQKTTDIFPEYGNGVFEALLPSANVFQHGFFDRFDQVRGVSPLASGLNHLRDSHEGFDYALAKMKVSQLFALAFYRDKVGNDPIDPTDWKKFKLDGPKAIDLDPGDRVEWLESKTPSNELQSFQMLVLQLSLKSLDIPFSFFNESFTNYSGARQALLQYEQSASNRRQDVVEFLVWVTNWVLWMAYADNDLTQTEYEDLIDLYEWVHASLPWLDPLKEVSANKLRLSAGLTCRRDLLKEEGKDWVDVVTQLAAEQKQLAELGLATSVADDNALIRELVTNGQ